MEIKWIAGLVIALLLGAAAGFGSSFQTGIQPGYFEKQEAPAYGVAVQKALGADFGKEFEDHFKELYADK